MNAITQTIGAYFQHDQLGADPITLGTYADGPDVDVTGLPLPAAIAAAKSACAFSACSVADMERNYRNGAATALDVAGYLSWLNAGFKRLRYYVLSDGAIRDLDRESMLGIAYKLENRRNLIALTARK